MKTVSAALVICLNIGVDPPDLDKIHQSSKIECWTSKFISLIEILRVNCCLIIRSAYL